MLSSPLVSVHSAQPANTKGYSAIVYQAEDAFPELFEAVQTAKVLGDYKTFVDAIPNQDPNVILQKYESLKDTSDFDLKAFVLDNFSLPQATKETKVTHEASLQVHLKNHWKNLVRQPVKTSEFSSLIELPNPYVVPGGALGKCSTGTVTLPLWAYWHQITPHWLKGWLITLPTRLTNLVLFQMAIEAIS